MDGRTVSPVRLAVFTDDAQGRRMNPPTTKIKNSIAIETVLTWNRPLYRLTPDPKVVT